MEKIVADCIQENEDFKTFQVKIPHEYLDDVFSRLYGYEVKTDESLSKFQRRIDSLGHMITGNDGDDNYAAIAATTAAGKGDYASDEEASYYAKAYAKAKENFDNMNFVVWSLGFSEEYWRWKDEQN